MSQVHFLEPFVTPTRFTHLIFTNIARQSCSEARYFAQLFVFRDSLQLLQGHLHAQSPHPLRRCPSNYIELHRLRV